MKKIPDRTMLVKAKEKDRIRTIRDVLTASLENLHDGYPSIDGMSEFMQRIFSLDMQPGRAKQAIAGIAGAARTVRSLGKQYVNRVARTHGSAEAKQSSKEFIGRIVSVLDQAGRHLKVLEEVRQTFRDLPVVDDELFTVAIAGFPNVGKSTLLQHLTGSEPDVQPYAFTTKGLNVGYFEYKYNRIQCMDTPGTLNREEMNRIEKKADITLRYLAHLIVYVFDPVQASYPLDDQKALYDATVAMGKDVIVYISKTDIATQEQIDTVKGMCKESYVNPEQLKKRIVEEFRDWV